MNCYILTGGRSKRMGQSKSAMFLDRVAAAARPVFDRVLAVQRFGTEPLAIETIFEEQHENEAPAFGLLRALTHARARCFVLATDYPLIHSSVLRFLRERLETSGAAMLVPVWDGMPQVLCAGYAPEVITPLASRLAKGRFELWPLIEEVKGIIVDEAALRARFSGEILLNVNSPGELARVENPHERS